MNIPPAPRFGAVIRLINKNGQELGINNAAHMANAIIYIKNKISPLYTLKHDQASPSKPFAMIAYDPRDKQAWPIVIHDEPNLPDATQFHTRLRELGDRTKALEPFLANVIDIEV